jgi:hypothetical protein
MTRIERHDARPSECLHGYATLTKLSKRISTATEHLLITDKRSRSLRIVTDCQKQWNERREREDYLGRLPSSRRA